MQADAELRVPFGQLDRLVRLGASHDQAGACQDAFAMGALNGPICRPRRPEGVGVDNQADLF
jgi:hypothetical protein